MAGDGNKSKLRRDSNSGGAPSIAFQYNARICIHLLPVYVVVVSFLLSLNQRGLLALMLPFGGGVAVTVAFSGSSSKHRGNTFIALWVTVGCTCFAIWGALLMSSLSNEELIAWRVVLAHNITIVMFTSGVWGALQFSWVWSESPQIARFMERALFSMAPLPVPVILTWGIVYHFYNDAVISASPFMLCALACCGFCNLGLPLVRSEELTGTATETGQRAWLRSCICGKVESRVHLAQTLLVPSAYYIAIHAGRRRQGASDYAFMLADLGLLFCGPLWIIGRAFRSLGHLEPLARTERGLGNGPLHFAASRAALPALALSAATCAYRIRSVLNGGMIALAILASCCGVAHQVVFIGPALKRFLLWTLISLSIPLSYVCVETSPPLHVYVLSCALLLLGAFASFTFGAYAVISSRSARRTKHIVTGLAATSGGCAVCIVADIALRDAPATLLVMLTVVAAAACAVLLAGTAQSMERRMAAFCSLFPLCWTMIFAIYAHSPRSAGARSIWVAQTVLLVIYVCVFAATCARVLAVPRVAYLRTERIADGIAVAAFALALVLADASRDLSIVFRCALTSVAASPLLFLMPAVVERGAYSGCMLVHAFVAPLVAVGAAHAAYIQLSGWRAAFDGIVAACACMISARFFDEALSCVFPLALIFACTLTESRIFCALACLKACAGLAHSKNAMAKSQRAI